MTWGWILLTAFGVLATVGALMNWMWALIGAGIAGVLLFLVGVNIWLGWWGVAALSASLGLIAGAVIYREAKDNRRTDRWIGRLTED